MSKVNVVDIVKMMGDDVIDIYDIYNGEHDTDVVFTEKGEDVSLFVLRVNQVEGHLNIESFPLLDNDLVTDLIDRVSNAMGRLQKALDEIQGDC